MTKILVVDDEPGTIHLLKLALRKTDYDVIAAMNGPEAIRLAEEEMPDLILLDLMMPGMDGSEVYKRLREGEKTSDIPVIMISASADLLLQAEENLDKDFVTIKKAEGISELLERIESALASGKGD